MDELLIPDKIVKSFRKTLALQIDKNGDLIVKAPKFVSDKKIEKFIKEKSDWIIKNKQKIIERKREIPPKEFIDGELFFYLGDYFKLQIVEGQKKPLIFESGVFYFSSVYIERGKEVFLKWYKKEAKKRLVERVEFYSKKFGLEYNNIKITSAGTRWGSCSSRKNINLHWKLIMAPPEVLDYVVVHELSHLKEMNHSKKFWQHVELMQSDYKIWRKWLKQNGHILEV